MSLILHHYPNSPYAEKIRLMLAYAGVSWTSCRTEEAPPRTPLMTLSGGYNRIPIAQSGADIFCDSNLISREIARISGKPELSPEDLSEKDLQRQAFFEAKLFFACVNRGFSLGLLGQIAKERGVFNMLGLVKDRVGMKKTATISMGSPKSAPFIIQNAIDELSPELSDKPYLGGDSPSFMDFALYHDLWFVKVVGKKELGKNAEIMDAWFDRMTAFSSSPAKHIDVQDALLIAQDAEPRVIPEGMTQGDWIGKQVEIVADDYRRIPISGVLVGADDYSWIIKREPQEGNTLHVHFPKRGYDLSLLQS